MLFVPRAPTPGPDLPGLDKAVHVVVFAVLALAACRRFGRRTTVALALSGYAIGSEVVQAALLRGRSGDVLDVVADLVGATLGWVIAKNGGDHLG